MVNPFHLNISHSNKIVVAVCVYNRFENVETWVRCWKQSNKYNAELVIVHNHYGDNVLRKKFEDYCNQNEVFYVPRNSPGFDVGAFQDVCRERLNGFPDFNYLLWCCDDTIPMTKDFIKPFIDTLYNTGVGISCMQISISKPGGVKHVRTTGFCITKETSLKLRFISDQVKTKQDCYHFEHKGGGMTMTEQIRSMGLCCQQVAPNSTSPLWDSGYWKRLDRYNEHQIVFGGQRGNDKVVFICPIYNMYPQIISSLLCQTHKNWELLLIYNGPCDNNLPDIVKHTGDARIKFIEYPEATGKWGHKLRQWALEEIRQGRLSDADYVTITNADNYHAPTYCEYLLKGFKKSHTAVATYCEKMVHNYKAWDVILCSFKLGFLDCAGVMVKKSVACEVGWRDTESHSSDWTYFSDIAVKYSPRSFVSVPGCLLVHN